MSDETTQTDPSGDRESSEEASLAGLLRLSRHLRGPDGCDWDRAQTLATLAPFLVEESFESLHAIESGDLAASSVELGDLSFVLALTLVTGESEGLGPIQKIFDAAETKLRRRHPHVFESKGSLSKAELWRQWERTKQAESDDTPTLPDNHLRNPGPALPALLVAKKLQVKAAALGFDWDAVSGVIEKVREEVDEVQEAIKARKPEEIREEIGDLLFAAVNLARFLDVDPESALRQANEKFRSRFNRMIDKLVADGHQPDQLSLTELDRYWERVKTEEGR